MSDSVDSAATDSRIEATFLAKPGRNESARTDITRHVTVQKWEESEAGWGQRPDGFSLHLSDEDRAKFVEAYWAKMPDAVPAEYERPCGTPYLAEAEPSTVARLKELRANGIFGERVYNKPYPGNGGTDGWQPQRPYHGGKA